MKKTIILVLGIVLISSGCVNNIDRETDEEIFREYSEDVLEQSNKTTGVISDFYKSLSETYGEEFLRITNPVGYQTQIIYAEQNSDSGLEIEKFSTFTENGIEKLKLVVSNNGDVDANKVIVNVVLTEGFEVTENPNTCTESTPCEISKTSKKELIYEYDGNGQPDTVGIEIQYEYSSNSRLPITFMSREELENKADEIEFDYVNAIASSSPILLSISTTGLRQPIIEGQDYHIEVIINTNRTNVALKNLSLSLEIPHELAVDRCSPNVDEIPFKWNNFEGKRALCRFETFNDPIVDSQTYYVTADATYSITHTRIMKGI